MRIPTTSVRFIVLLGMLVALPSFGIDTSLPALGAVASALHVAPAEAGLTMSVFMLGFACAPLVYGPVSDRYGRKPVVMFACLLFTIGAIGCAMARSLSDLLVWRLVQGAGSGASVTIAMAIVRDLFEGPAARVRMSYITMTMMIVPTIAPTLGVGLMTLGGWRVIHAFLAGVGALLSLLVLLGLAESAPHREAKRLAASLIAGDYVRVLTHPACRGYLLVAAATFGALFAYVSGSPLFLVGVAGLSSEQYGLVFAATSLGIMMGSFLNGRINAKGISYRYPLNIGLTLASVTTLLLLFMTLAGWMPLALVVPLLVLCNVAFGMVMPNAMERAMEPLPEVAGVAGAAMGCIQMTTGAAISGLVATFHDGHSAFSMTALMALCSLLASAAYLLLARPSELAIMPERVGSSTA
jgi:DHA1 family bicyclomycin/chloramphenicol resistance-like MFS transporter